MVLSDIVGCRWRSARVNSRVRWLIFAILNHRTEAFCIGESIMFEILSTLIIQALSKIFGTSVDAISKEVSWKRSTAVALIELYDSLLKLELASQTAYETFDGYLKGTKVPLKTTIRDTLQRLFTVFEVFIKKLRTVESKLSIYDSELYLALVHHALFTKTRTLATIDLITEVIPSAEKDNGGKLTYLITYPTELPAAHSFGTKKAPVLGPDLEDEVKKLKRSLLSKFKKKTIDMSITAEGEIALKFAEENIKQIERVRRSLADFIQQNFPLKDILR